MTTVQDHPPPPPPPLPHPAEPVMHGQTAVRLLVVAVLVGALAEYLIHDNLLYGAPSGLGMTLAGILTAAVWLAAPPALGQPRVGPVRLLAGLMVLFSIMLTVRAAPELAAMNISVLLLLVLAMAYVYRGRGFREVALGEYPGAALRAAVGAVTAGADVVSDAVGPIRRLARRTSGMGSIGRGILLAAIPLLLFVALFASADAVFANFIGRPFRWETSLEGFVAGAALAAILAWLALGLLRYAMTHDDWPEPRPEKGWSRGGVTEATTALVLINAVFLAFVVVQFTYLFGGSGRVRSVTGLTYAQYARQGFFQLVIVAALVVALVLTVDAWVSGIGGKRNRVVDRLHASLIALTGVVLASAVVRLWVLVGEFGLSKVRFYGAAAMAWIAVLLVWMGITVLRGRRNTFAAGGLLAGLLLAAGLNVVSPDAVIATVNIDRHIAGSTQLDIPYAAFDLSADAVPVLIAAVDEIGGCDGVKLANALTAAGAKDGDGWRSYNMARRRAGGALESLVEPAPARNGC